MYISRFGHVMYSKRHQFCTEECLHRYIFQLYAPFALSQGLVQSSSSVIAYLNSTKKVNVVNDSYLLYLYLLSLSTWLMCGFYQSLLVDVVTSRCTVVLTLPTCYMLEMKYSGGCVCVCVCVLHVSYVSFRFYLARANLNNEHIESMRSSDIPDVVSVMTTLPYPLSLY